MKILYIGCVESSYVLLESLLKSKANVVSIITRRKSDFNSDYKNLKPLGNKYNIEVAFFDNINSDESIKYISDVSPDVIYCFGWSQLLKPELLSLSPKGVIGFHPTRLPNNKGRHPIIWALVLGLDKTASSFFIMDEKADNGAIVSQRDISISSQDYAQDLYLKILNVAKDQVIEITKALANDSLQIIETNKSGNIWRKRTEADGIIDFRISARNIYNLVRALSKPYIGADFLFEGKKYKVWKCEVIIDKKNEYDNIEFGKVITSKKEFFVVKTGEELLKIYKSEAININEGVYL